MYEKFGEIESDIFSDDNAAFEYQYEQGPVGAQSVLPVHMRSNPNWATDLLRKGLDVADAIIDRNKPEVKERPTHQPTRDDRSESGVPSKIKEMTIRQLKKLTPTQLQSRIRAISARQHYVRSVLDSNKLKNVLLAATLRVMGKQTLQKEESFLRNELGLAQNRLKELNRKAQTRTLPILKPKASKPKVGKPRWVPPKPRPTLPSIPSMPVRPKMKPSYPRPPVAPPAPPSGTPIYPTAPVSATEEGYEDYAELKALLEAIATNPSHPQHTLVMPWAKLAEHSECGEFYLIEILRAIAANDTIPEIDMTICGPLPDTLIKSICDFIRATPVHPQHRLVVDLYTAALTAHDRGANQDCIEYQLVQVITDLFYGRPVVAPNMSDCEAVVEPTLAELKALLAEILANPADPDHGIIASAYQQVLEATATGASNQKELEDELEYLMTTIYQARKAKTNAGEDEEGWFAKNKWYVVGGAAVLAGAGILWATTRK